HQSCLQWRKGNQRAGRRATRVELQRGPVPQSPEDGRVRPNPGGLFYLNLSGLSSRGLKPRVVAGLVERASRPILADRLRVVNRTVTLAAGAGEHVETVSEGVVLPLSRRAAGLWRVPAFLRRRHYILLSY